jgi:UDP-N-acetylglucosamine 2-epimerase (non-hydrolysing)
MFTKKIIFFLLFLLLFKVGQGVESKPILLVVGTRPEAIKVFPLLKKLQENEIPSLLCFTGQHADLVKEICPLFNVTPDFDLKIMKKNQDLNYITQIMLVKMQEVLKTTDPSLVIVQGDTTSAMAAALAAFYEKIPVAHLEAGLRSFDISSPYPEEMNRRVISLICLMAFCSNGIG